MNWELYLPSRLIQMVLIVYNIEDFVYALRFIGITSILARVGVSFISSEQACSNAEEEISDFNFESVRTAARAEWNELLGRVQVDTAHVDDEIVELFYSSLYRTHISPADCEHYDHCGLANVIANISYPQIPVKIHCGTPRSHTMIPSIAMYAPLPFNHFSLRRCLVGHV